ncbi:hypothetical protein GALMADRAFT_1359410 [Galerina marginata CBS 339.88]|uniref:Uncharacterized protein n=1 Tax=Galerina marginata (strain CBS 339.88) TaxID=685588 RepID=A0A067SFX0_GALM3|nr:hypothetical protein GALMADRAFT_1359410 [Galerina marginata CBS 339.88]
MHAARRLKPHYPEPNTAIESDLRSDCALRDVQSAPCHPGLPTSSKTSDARHRIRLLGNHLMEVRRPKQIPIAYRFFPYNQWFLAHVDPTWKIRHLKQIILTKCLSFPFDPRKVVREAAGVPPPSPITFAPDESQRPASPIKFASVLEGQGDDGVEGAGAGVGSAGSSGGTGAGTGVAAVTSTAAAAAGTSVHGAHAPKAEEDGPGAGVHEDVVPGKEGYKEDDEWDEDDGSDDHELGGGGSRPIGGHIGAGGFGGWVELPGPPLPPLGSVVIPAPQPRPASAVSSPAVKTARKFNPLAKLFGEAVATNSTSNSNAGAVTSDGLAAAAPAPHHLPQDKPHKSTPIPLPSPVSPQARSSKKSFWFRANVLIGFAGAVHLAKALVGLLPPPVPLHYPQEKKGGPYWKGWVHALRVVWRSEMPLPLPIPSAARGGVLAASAGGFGAGARGVPLFGGAGVGAERGGGGGACGGRGGRDDGYGRRVKTKLEWRERWVVIRDGVINLCKTREFACLSFGLVILFVIPMFFGATFLKCPLIFSYLSLTASYAIWFYFTWTQPRPSERGREHRRSTSAPRSSTSTAKDPPRTTREDGEGIGVGTMPPVSSRTRGGTDIENDRRLRPPGLASTPASTSGLTEAERRAREVERQRERQRKREKEQEKERQRRRRREQEEKELECLRRWDDVAISFGKEKDKAKGKEKEGERTRDNGKEKGRGASSRHDKRRERRDKDKGRKQAPS